MADAVKNSARNRRPPSHLREDLNEDNFEPSNPQQSRSRETTRQNADPCSLPTMARLLSKFVTSANKKLQDHKVIEAEAKAALLSKKQAMENPKNLYRSAKDDKRSVGSKAPTSTETKYGSNPTQAIKPKQPGINPQGSSQGEFKPTKNQNKTIESTIKNGMSSDYYRIESMAKMSREQLMKMMPKGFDPSIMKEPIKQMPEASSKKAQTKPMENYLNQGGKPGFGKPEAKLFKRASFHIGIAYNIHIENIKRKYSNFNPEELDPTYISRKMKQQSMLEMMKHNEEAEKLKNQKNSQPKQKEKMKSPNKQYICIDLQNEEQDKSGQVNGQDAQMKADSSSKQQEEGKQKNIEGPQLQNGNHVGVEQENKAVGQ